ncbi:MAG: hypothetical protein KDB53_00505, partial [Planctomycetes bacterium]|nr:hypothetical protein [Planctomycetota bacterium]
MRVCCPTLVTLILMVTSSLAQERVESDFFVADRGNAMNGSDGAVRHYSYTGNLIATLPAAGSGQVRGLGVAEDGTLYVARGDGVLAYAPPYNAGVTFDTGVKAQDVAVHRLTGNIWCSYGATPTEAEIREITPGGTVVQTLTSPLLQHPRKLTFGLNPDELFIANSAGGNVIGLTVTTGAFLVHINLSSQMATPIGIAASPIFQNRLFVVSDYGSAQTIYTVDGALGSGSASTLVDYSASTDMIAPSGLDADGYGNVFVTNRQITGSTPGVYCFRQSGIRPVTPYTGSENIRPVDLAFVRHRLVLNVTSSDGTFTNGVPRVLFGPHQATVNINIDCPDYPSASYGLFWSLYTGTVFETFCTQPGFEFPFGDGIQIDLADARRAAIVPDALYLSGVQILQRGGSG